MRNVSIKTSEESEECVGAYLCLCGPLLPLLFLTVISAIWNELSVYELSGAQNNNNLIIHHTEWNQTKQKNNKKVTAARKMKHTSVISTVMGSENSLIISVSVKKHLWNVRLTSSPPDCTSISKTEVHAL